jgi:hypothetical protein
MKYLYICMHTCINISLINVLDSFLWLQIQMLMFFTVLWLWHCLFLRLVCWIAWQWMLPFPIRQQLRVFDPRLPLVGCALWCRQDLRSGYVSSWYMRSRQSLPPTGQACELELSFSLGRLSVSACSQVLQGSTMLSFHHSAAESPHSHSVSCPPPFSGRGEMLLLSVWPPVLSWRGSCSQPLNCARLCGFL